MKSQRMEVARWSAWAATLILGATVAVSAQAVETAPAFPVPGQGADSKTLLVHSATRTAYGLGDALAALRLQMRRVSTRLTTTSIAEVASNTLAEADYLVVFCPQPGPELPAGFLQTMASRTQPVLWIGFGLDQLETLPRFADQFEASAQAADRALDRVQYRGRAWTAPVFPWIPVTLGSNAGERVVMRLDDTAKTPAAAHPLCWAQSNFTFLAAVPASAPMHFLFGDLLLDFFGVAQVAPARVFLRLDGVSAWSNQAEFRRMVDFLQGRNLPFIVGVVPATRDPVTGHVDDLDTQPEFVASLRHAQQHGGRLILHGYTGTYTNEPGAGHEFWDVDSDRPLPEDNAAYARQRLLKGARQMLKHGLFPLAWATPHYAAPRVTYAEVARVFSTGVERVQLSDATWQDLGTAAAFTRDRHGRWLVPENLGFVRGGAAGDPFADVKAAAETVLGLRGAVGGCSLHAYQPLARLTGLVAVMEEWKTPFLDLADLDHAVVLPEAVLLVGRARHTATVRKATVRWRAFSRDGQQLAEEQEATLTEGTRTFERRGRGDYELFEITETGEDKS